MSPDPLDPAQILLALTETHRLAAVKRVLELRPSVEDDATHELESLTLRLGDVPLAAATVLDGTTQHFLATSAGPKGSMDREVSHCQYVISTGAFLCIQDMTTPESRWSKLKRAIIGDEPIAAYLGFPLVFDGLTVGAVCAVDTHAREWTSEDHYAVYRSSVRVSDLITEAAALRR